MEKTALEQFIEQLEKQGDSWENVSIGRIQISIDVEDYLKLQTQAKEMEKQQIIEAYDEAEGKIIGRGEKYYNENYKSE